MAEITKGEVMVAMVKVLRDRWTGGSVPPSAEQAAIMALCETVVELDARLQKLEPKAEPPSPFTVVIRSDNNSANVYMRGGAEDHAEEWVLTHAKVPLILPGQETTADVHVVWHGSGQPVEIIDHGVCVGKVVSTRRPPGA